MEELDLSGNAGLVDPVHINTIAGKPYNASSRVSCGAPARQNLIKHDSESQTVPLDINALTFDCEQEGGLKDLKRLTLVGTGIRDKLLRDSSPKTLEAYFRYVAIIFFHSW